MLIALAILILLCLAALIAAVVSTGRQASGLSAEREQSQLQNAILTRLTDMRSDLTSVTFWDEAVEKTALNYDRPWAEDNIGRWLSEFYDVDRSFLLDGQGRLLLASRAGATVDGREYGPYRRMVAPMVRWVGQKTRGYQARTPASASDRTRGLDRAGLAMVDGKPVYIIVAAILPDFGRISRYPQSYDIIVAVHDFDDRFLAIAARSVLIDRLKLVGKARPPARNEVRLAIPALGSEVRWHSREVESELAVRTLPIIGMILLMLLMVGGIGLVFLRRSARALFVSRFEATHDELTGLPNRRLLTGEIDDTLGAGRRFALMFIDLDRFKEVNDLWGHVAGDQVLKETAERLAAVADLTRVARFGGDEFVVLLDPAAHAGRSARAILDALRRPYDIAGTSVVLAGSIGIALAPAHGNNAGELMRKADLALYRAKDLGKDRYVIFDEEMSDELQARRQLEHDLRTAIAAGAMTVAYQPVCSANGTIVGLEALIRWCHPVHGEMEPADFIPLAEETALICEIDRFVLQVACEQAAAWQAVTLSANVSPVELRSPAFVETVRTILDQTGLPAGRLRLEITETALLSHACLAAETIAELRTLGVRVALDDFGTGYSSLDHLRTLPLDSFKIDRSFVAGLSAEGSSYALLASIVALGHALGLTVTAEGVESPEQFALLRAAGCDEYQGFLIGRPVAADEIVTKLVRLTDAA